MADDPNPELRAEMEAAIAILDPQIEGLIELARTSLEAATLEIVVDERIHREAVREDCRSVIARIDDLQAALNVLEAAGGPIMPPLSIPAEMLAEMKHERDEIDAGISIFEAQPVVSKAKTSFPAPTPKPTA